MPYPKLTGDEAPHSVAVINGRDVLLNGHLVARIHVSRKSPEKAMIFNQAIEWTRRRLAEYGCSVYSKINLN